MNIDSLQLPPLVLFHYWRSSASYRARIALNIKQLNYEIQPVHLLEQGGQQHLAGYREINPQSLVPTLVHNGIAIGQSLAIIEYVDEVFPNNFLLPAEPVARAKVRGIALYIASEGQPMMNLRVLQYLESQHSFNEQAKADWVRHWLAINFQNIEQQLVAENNSAPFVTGNQPGMLECCLVPHEFAAQRFNLDMSAYPTVNRIVANCLVHPAFIKAHPARQIDTPDEFRITD